MTRRHADRTPATIRPTTPPTEVTLNRTTGRLELSWGDGNPLGIPVIALRMACRCATCMKQRYSGHPPTAASDISLVAIEIYGVSALRLHFSDGHNQGLYPWRYLLELGQCKPNTEPCLCAESSPALKECINGRM